MKRGVVRRILVTGVTGFVGWHLCRALVESNEVWGLARREPNAIERHPNLRWIVHDLSSATWPSAMPERLDVIVHLAQSQHYREFPDRALDMFRVNCLGTERLLDLAYRTGVSTFVYTSTGGIYGTGPHAFKETDEFRPSGPLRHYFTTKYTAELLLADYALLFKPIILRPFFVYGVGQDPKMLIPRLVARIAVGEAVTLYGESGIRINPVHVSDMVVAIVRALERRDSLMTNLAGPEVWSLRDIAVAIGNEVGRPPIFTVIPTDSPPHLVADISLMTRELGAPKVRFAEVVSEVCRELLVKRAGRLPEILRT